MPTPRRKTTAKRAPAWTKTINPKAFASLDAGPAHVESMLHVYWSGYGDARDARDGGMGHRMMRDKVTASLGLDHAIEPGFTAGEMQKIAYAAKMAAMKCLRERACDRNYAEGARCGRKKNHKGACKQFDREPLTMPALTITAIDRRRLADGDLALALPEPKNRAEIRKQLPIIHDGMLALQSLDNLGKEGNRRAHENLAKLEKRYDDLKERFEAEPPR